VRKSKQAPRTKNGRRALVVYIDKATQEALASIMRERGFSLKRDAVVWALKHAAPETSAEHDCTGEFDTNPVRVHP
jgi:hypothetical protein